jgi:outer membrane protein OmpA-like peptidoglycan-associated protein
MKRIKHSVVTVTLVAALMASSGCSSWGGNQKKGTVIGAGGGAVLGGLIGHKTGSTATGAIIGAAVGGAAGSLIGRRMDTQAEKLARELEGAQVSRVGEGIAVTFDSGILFPYDSSNLTGPAQSNLDKLALSLQSEPQTEVMIVGHTDSDGAEVYNQQLSEHRSQAASSYLSSRGVAFARLHTRGRGEAEPIASNAGEEGKRQNRRVEVAIYASEALKQEAKKTSGTR